MMKLNWVCYGTHTGYAQAAQDMMIALDRSGLYDIRMELMLRPKLSKEAYSPERYEFLQRMINKPKSKDSITVYHCIPTVQHRVKPTNRTIGFGVFETFQPPSAGAINWIKILNTNNAVITPSLFNTRIFSNEDINKPIFYIPHCYDTQLFHPDVEPLKEYNRFTFLFFGSWRKRKGYPQLIEAWCKEFKTTDGVQLVIKTDKLQAAKAEVKKIIEKHGYSEKEIAPILFENTVLNDQDLPRFLKSVDCLVSPTLGEGFGLPGLQCMALGVPIIITDFSGCQDYANDETATLIKPPGFIILSQLDAIPQFTNKKWALVTAKAVQDAMRNVLLDYGSAKEKARKGQKYAAEKFNYSVCESRFNHMIETVFNV